MLRVIRRLKEENIIPVKATFLGAHAMPMEYKTNRPGYIKLIKESMLPQIAQKVLRITSMCFVTRDSTLLMKLMKY
jgi:imidazolonepropionase